MYPTGGRIAFQTDRDGNDEIYVMGCDGSGQTNLTNNSADDRQPSWASGGKLAFSSDRRSTVIFDIYLLTINPWGVERLTTNSANDESPALSPDGSKVAFVSYRDDDKGDIYVLDISSNSITRLTDDDKSDLDPAWSPDGAKIAFASDRGGNFDIYKLNADGTGDPEKVTTVSHSTGNDRWPDLGDYLGDEVIAFASDRITAGNPTDDWEVFTYDSYLNLLEQATTNSDGKIDSNPSWNEVGDDMTYHTTRNSSAGVNDVYDVYKAYIDGSETKDLTKDDSNNNSSPDWEPVDNGVTCGK